MLKASASTKYIFFICALSKEKDKNEPEKIQQQANKLQKVLKMKQEKKEKEGLNFSVNVVIKLLYLA